ncbi:InlB B-repeat-containing protein [Pseudoneobacillus sp. C159]
MREKKISYWFSQFLILLLLISSLSPLPAKAADEIKKTTVHTFGSNTWAYSSLAKGPNDELYLAHVISGSEIAIKRWNGATWDSMSSVATTATGDSGIGGPLHLITDKSGNLHLGFQFFKGSGVTSYRGIKYGFFNNQTKSWSFQEIEAYSDSNGWKNFDDPSVAVDSTGAVHMVYMFDDANNRNHYVKYATNKSGTWTKDTIVTSNGAIDEMFDPQIVVDDKNDQVHATYIREDQQNTYYGNVYYTTKKASDATFPTATKLINSTGDQKNYWSYPLTLDRNGAVYIAYSDPSTSYILSDATGSWKREQIYVDGSRTTGPFSVQFVGSDLYLLMESWKPDWSDVHYFVMRKTTSGWENGTKTIAPAEPGPTSEMTYSVDSQGNFMLVMLDDNLRIISSLSGSSSAFGLIPVGPPEPTYTVSYDGNGHSGGNAPFDGKQYKQGDTVTVLGNTGNLQKTGYSFTNWNSVANGTGTTYPATGSGTLTMPGSNITLYAQWKPNTYTVTYNPDGGVVGKTTQVKLFDSTYGKGADGVTADPMPIPTKTGSTFAGWYTQLNGAGSQVIDSTKVMTAGNHTLYAKWLLSQYTVSFHVDGGSAVPNQLVNHGGNAVEPTPPTKQGHTFAGWYTDNTFKTVFDFKNNAITSNTTIYAKWNINQYTVNFDSNGGSPVAPITANYNTTIAQPPQPTKIGYTFNGWFKETGFITEWNFASDKVTGNTTLYAKWTINKHTVSFDVDGGSAVPPQTVNHFEKAVEPTAPTKTGHTFAGWFTDKTYTTAFDFNNMTITGPTTIYAKWTINQYTVTFNSNGGSTVAPVITNYNTTIATPTPPTRTGYTFNGWFKEAGLNTAWDFASDKVTDNTTLYAKWTINSYTVSFDVDGGSAVPPQTVNHFEKAVEPTAPTKTGHTFAGWFTDKTYTTAFDFNNMTITGPTTIYAKWTINQYIVSFITDGGSIVLPISATYNTTITPPAAPTKTGYTFDGWYKDAELKTSWNFATDKVTENTTLYAKWTINSYTVSFDVDGGSVVPPQTVNHFEKAVEPPAPTKTGHTFAGWFTDKTYTTAFDFNNMTITGPTTIYAKWTINQYTVSFDTNGGSAVAPVTTNYNTTIATPTPPTRTGYTFNGWFKEAGLNTAWDFASDKVTDNTTLYAKWTINSYTVSFDVDGGSVVPPQTVNHFEKAIEPPAPTKTGHTFAGWFTDKTYTTGFDFNNMTITGPTTIYAKWTINQYIVSFITDGGSIVLPISATYNTTITPPAAPTKTGYTFDGWYKDAELKTAWNFATDKVSENTTLYAKWTINSYTVSFDVDGGSVVPAQTINHFDKVVEPPVPTKTGHTFAGWFTDKTYTTAFDFNNMTITGPTTIYAKWTINQYTVSFDTNGGSAVAPVTTNYNTTIATPTPPTRTGYTFNGWFKEAGLNTAWDFASDKVTDNTTLYAKWTINSYTVSFDIDGGSAVPPQTVNHFEKAVEPTAPTKTGHTFAGWFTDKTYTTAFDFNNMTITGPTTIYAKWTINQYIVSFITDGGSIVLPISATYNTTITPPAAPTKTGYTFDGWYKDAELKTSWNFATDKVTENTTLYAKWTINSYTVSFDVDGGSVVPPQTVNHFEKAIEPPAPTKTGHTFAGWFTDKTYTTGFDFNNMTITGPTTIYAKWTINQYTVTFDSNGGSAVAPVTTNYNTTITAPAAPTRIGYTFDGWYSDTGLNTAWDFASDKVTDNTTLYAKWIINSYTINFDVVGGSAVATQTINHFDKVVEPTPPRKAGHTFAGWYKDQDYTKVWDFQTDLVTGTMTLYAKWDVRYYQVIFHTNSDATISPILAEYSTTISAPVIPDKPGYTFAGWFKDQGFQTAWDFLTDRVNSSTNLYAKWIVKDQPGNDPIIEDRLVDVETGSVEDGKKITQIKIKRTTQPSGTVKDEITLTEEMVKTLMEQGLSSARIMLPDREEKIDEVFIHLPKSVAERLAVSKIHVELYLEGVRLAIPSTSIQNVKEDLFFRIVPIRGEKDRLALLNRVKAEEAIKKAAGNRSVEVLGSPMEIQTNMQGRPVTIRMPLESTKLSQKMLDNLVVFIEHSDGTKELIQGKLITLKDGSLEVEFSVSKFSTFVLMYVDGWKDYMNAKTHTAYINGYSDNTFRPNQNVTRAQMAAMLMRNLGVKDVAGLGHYDDVQETHWAYKEIMLAKQSGIMMGTGDSFNPNASITRAQMATIIYRWLKNECAKDANAFEQCSTLGQKGGHSYSDVGNDHWAYEAILAIKQFGIMEGYEDGTFKPNALLTRAQAVKVLNRLFKRGPLEGDITPTFTDVPNDHWAFKEIEEAVRNHRYIQVDNSEIFVSE